MKRTLIYTILYLMLPFSLLAHNKTDSLQSATKIVADQNSSIPGLTRDRFNRPVISWVQALSENRFQFCYAISPDMGKTFSEPVIVTPSTSISPHAENAPKLLFKPSGEIIAVWGVTETSLKQGKIAFQEEHATHQSGKIIEAKKSKYAGQIYYSQSFDEGANWTAARPLVNDPAGFDQRYFDIALNKRGEAVIIWLDNRKESTKEGSALYIATSHEQEGFQQQHKIAETTCQCCRTKLHIDEKQQIHVVYRAILNDSIRDMVHQVSSDEGRSFSTPKRIHEDNWVVRTCPHTGPTMTSNRAGLHFAWYSAAPAKASYYAQSTDNGGHFSEYAALSELARHPQMASLGNGEIALVWDEVSRSGPSPTTSITIEWKSADGKTTSRQSLTNPEEMASYPVLIPLEEGCMVAYQVKTAKGQRIGWQIHKK